jgi:hypothetical protein
MYIFNNHGYGDIKFSPPLGRATWGWLSPCNNIAHTSLQDQTNRWAVKVAADASSQPVPASSVTIAALLAWHAHSEGQISKLPLRLVGFSHPDMLIIERSSASSPSNAASEFLLLFSALLSAYASQTLH